MPVSEALRKITFEDFLKVDVRVGRIVDAELFPEAKKPAYKLTVDFGKDIGLKKTSAQITKVYDIDDLTGRLVMGVVNFSPKQIGPFVSEILVLGVPDEKGDVVLIRPDEDTPLGGRLF